MWVLKSRGKSYYIDHLEADLPFSTKETPDNPHTKGAIKFKNVHVTINEENVAQLRRATALDLQEQKEKDKPPIRVIADGVNLTKLTEVVKKFKIQHDPIKKYGGECRDDFFVFDLKRDQDFTLLSMATDVNIRLLNANEHYYTEYSK